MYSLVNHIQKRNYIGKNTDGSNKNFPILENGKMFAIFNLKKRQWVMI